LLIILSGTINTEAAEPQKSCPTNEALYITGYGKEPTCENQVNKQTPCDHATKKAKCQCQCKTDYYRYQTVCIPKEQCKNLKAKTCPIDHVFKTQASKALECWRMYDQITSLVKVGSTYDKGVSLGKTNFLPLLGQLFFSKPKTSAGKYLKAITSNPGAYSLAQLETVANKMGLCKTKTPVAGKKTSKSALKHALVTKLFSPNGYLPLICGPVDSQTREQVCTLLFGGGNNNRVRRQAEPDVPGEGSGTSGGAGAAAEEAAAGAVEEVDLADIAFDIFVSLASFL